MTVRGPKNESRATASSADTPVDSIVPDSAETQPAKGASSGVPVNYGSLVPVGGGDPVPMLKNRLRIGRREDCDIVLNFANVSGHHCLMELVEGYWFIKDLRSRNGIKVDGKRILAGLRKRIDAGMVISVAKHQYKVDYDPTLLGAYGTPPQDEILDNLFSESLLDRAGLSRKPKS